MTFTSPVFLDVVNSDSTIINQSNFHEIIESGPKLCQSNVRSNKFRVRNDHVADGGCTLKSTGRVMMTGNRLGFVIAGELEFTGGDTLQ